MRLNCLREGWSLSVDWPLLFLVSMATLEGTLFLGLMKTVTVMTSNCVHGIRLRIENKQTKDPLRALIPFDLLIFLRLIYSKERPRNTHKDIIYHSVI